MALDSGFSQEELDELMKDGWSYPTGGSGGGSGEPGKDGVSATHSWDGTVLTITSASGTSSADLVGPQGPDGEKGESGADGISCTHSWDGTTLTITSASGTSSANLQGPSTGGGTEAYSAEETVIGTWIDGKPLYRKVYTTKTSISTGVSQALFSISNLNAEFIQIEKSTIVIDDGASYPGNFYVSDTFYSMTTVGTAGLISRVGESSLTNRILIVIVNYTKTTDEATVAVASVEELNNAYNEGVQSA